jgi:hypothetical protein
MKSMNDFQAELHLRDEEKFKSLVQHIEKTQAGLTIDEKKEFDKLWRIYCNSLEEIGSIKHSINDCKSLMNALDKIFYKKLFYSFITIALIKFFLLNGELENYLLLIIFSLIILYEKINISIKKSQKLTEISIFENSIRQARLNLSFLGIYQVRYEEEYIDSNNELIGGSNDLVKEKYENFKDLHFTYVTRKLLELVKFSEV